MAAKGTTAAAMATTDSEEEVDDATFGAGGIDAINRLLHQLYPDQKNHLQATALIKFWLGGPDPLDYISMLLNPGNPGAGIAEHWHYISFGLSDLHGDNRVHEYTGPDKVSGFGFELSFRLQRHGEDSAPMWPATLMNSLARYVFQTGNTLDCGDHVPWNRPLDSQSSGCIQHMLITADPQLSSLRTPYGRLEFRQILGVTEVEMKAAQRWKGNGVISLISTVPQAGGPLFVTNLQRKHSIFDMDQRFKHVLAESIENDGSNLGNVTSACFWEEVLTDSTSSNVGAGSTQGRAVGRHGQRELTSVHLKFDLEAAELLPLVAKGRLMKARHFVFQNVSGQVMIFIPPKFSAEMVFVDAEHPLQAQEDALQIYCSREFMARMAKDLSILQNPHEVKHQLPKVFTLSQPNITITVVPVGAIPVS